MQKSRREGGARAVATTDARGALLLMVSRVARSTPLVPLLPPSAQLLSPSRRASLLDPTDLLPASPPSPVSRHVRARESAHLFAVHHQQGGRTDLSEGSTERGRHTNLHTRTRDHHQARWVERQRKRSQSLTLLSVGVSALLCVHRSLSLLCQDFSPVPKLSTNDYLRLASTFHSLHAITARGIHISPVTDASSAASSTSTGGGGGAGGGGGGAKKAPTGSDALPRNQEGILSLEAKDFRLQCFQTLTGLKFLLISSANFSSATLDKLLGAVYLNYADFVLKNPFYELEMPIRIESFDANLLRLIQGAMGYGASAGSSSAAAKDARRAERDRERERDRAAFDRSGGSGTDNEREDSQRRDK